jgi:hypothetical protein
MEIPFHVLLRKLRGEVLKNLLTTRLRPAAAGLRRARRMNTNRHECWEADQATTDNADDTDVQE